MFSFIELDWQMAVALLIVAMAAAIVSKNLLGSLKKSTSGTGCGGCGGCSANPLQRKPDSIQLVQLGDRPSNQ
jgi:hypothetical protein